jgi:endothelin-converting enzyme
MGSPTALCLTAPCVHAASEILYNLSPDYKNIDPCTNFEEFVCDGWRSRHDMRPDQGSLDSFTQIQESNQMTLRHILEAPYPGSSDVSTYYLVESSTWELTGP